jgi:hypothetical protein
VSSPGKLLNELTVLLKPPGFAPVCAREACPDPLSSRLLALPRSDVLLPQAPFHADGINRTDLKTLMAYEALIDFENECFFLFSVEINGQGRTDFGALLTADASLFVYLILEIKHTQLLSSP